MTASRDVRNEPSEIDLEWMAGALTEAGFDGSRLVGLTCQGEVGTGQVGRIARFSLEWSELDAGPATVIGKFPSADPQLAPALFGSGTYAKEFLFYDQIQPTVTVDTPRCYTARWSDEMPGFTLLLEDIADATQGDQIIGLSVGQVSVALRQAVGFHAPRFGDSSLGELISRGRPTPPKQDAAGFAQMFYAGFVGTFVEQVGDRLDAEVVGLLNDFAPLANRLFLRDVGPETLVHLDFRADNLMLRSDGSISVIDWQTLGTGRPGTDVAYLIAGSLADTAERAAVERDLVEEYRGALAAAGVDIAADEMWLDVRVGSLWGVFMSVTAGTLALRTERGVAMLAAMANRHAHQALDLDALDLLR